MTDIDLTTLTGDELDALWTQVVTERERRLTLTTAPAQAAQIAGAYLDARDGAVPAETAETLADVGAWPAWVQPTGAFDAYPQGRVVAHGGALWRSITPANVWEPGGEGASTLWEKVTASQAGTVPAAPTVPEWAAGVAYKVGDKVTYGGAVYQCVQTHTSQTGWDPASVPALWSLV